MSKGEAIGALPGTMWGENRAPIVALPAQPSPLLTQHTQQKAAAEPIASLDPRPPRPRTARLIGADNGHGLARDRTIVTEALRAAGWETTVLEGTPPPALDPVVLQIHLEVPAPHLLPAALHNVIIPHPEWWQPEWTPLLSQHTVRAWAKTADAERIFRVLGAHVERIGWLSLDRLDPAVPRRRAFLHVAGQSPHKGTQALLQAWRPEWPPLTVVATPRPAVDQENITTLGRVSDDLLRRLQNEHAFHLYPARYEGYGHAQWEGLSCGAVVFATDGPPFDEHPEIFRLLPAVRAGDEPVAWHDVPASSIADAVRWAMDASDSEISACRARSRQGWEDAAAAFEARIRAVLGPLIHRRITLHSPLPRCGVAEYGRQLDQALARVGCPMKAATLQDFSAVEALGPGDAVLVHFEPSILPHGLVDRLAAARRRGARTVFCCHFFDQGAAERFDDAADVFVVHRDYPFDIPKVRVLALGCPIYEPTESRRAVRARLGLPQDAVILTTLGLLSSWKRIPEIVGQLLAQRRPEDRLFLQVLTPLANEQFQAEAQIVRNLIEGRTDVLFSTEFRPEKDLLDRVYASDLGVLYHAQDTGSVSAATKQFISVRTPLVITGSSHASDLQGGVVRVEGFDPANLAEAVLSLARDERQRAALREEAEQEYLRLNMNEVARRFAAIFQESP